ncbi:hypothetical protein SteCoe_29234 [Stentor coeruleus]|uniref:C2H2-type domain-containing protein n=1 Tax=Stentor coeruleus TaxID=5963 RepID=A0A1R2B6E6_9CILI|nr:hypothetical protein SteCoe_29234 [Stentor coeruleus]
MLANYYDLSFLLGYSYVNKQFTIEGNHQIDIFSMSPTPFIKILPALVDSLLAIDRTKMPSILHPSRFLMNLIKREDKRSGCCLICNNHFPKIVFHMKNLHKMSRENVDKFYSIIGENSIYYMPEEISQVEFSRKKQIEYIYNFNSEELSYNQVKGYYLIGEISAGLTPSFVCGECGEIVHGSKVKRHKMKHKNEVIFSCQLCGGRFPIKKKRKHMKKCSVKIQD